MLRASRRPRRSGLVDLTPMIDVVFQLIIFFMFTSQFGQVSRTAVDLPEESGEQAGAEVPTLVIDVTLEGAYFVDARPIAFDRLLAVVEREAARFEDPGMMTVLIRPDRNATAGAVNRLADAFAGIGVRRWSFATNPEGGG